MEDKKTSGPKKLNRRKLLVFGAIGATAAGVTKFSFFPSYSSRTIASNDIPLTHFKQNIDFDNLEFVKLTDFTESTRFSRWLVRLSNYEFRKKYSKGHNTRQYSELAQYIPTGKLNLDDWSLNEVLSNSAKERNNNSENFYIRTETPNELDFEIQDLKVSNHQGSKASLSIENIRESEQDLGITMMECAGNDRYAQFALMSAAQWSGVTFSELLSSNTLLDDFKIDPELTHVKIEGFDTSTNTNWNRFPGLVESTPGASWIFTIEELKKHRAFFATKMNGEDLTSDHGHPLRLVVPCFYGCASIKWITSVEFFRPTETTPTEDQMREFSDRTNQTGEPLLYKDHRSPVVDLASVPVKYERWRDKETNKDIIRLIGLTWGGIDHKDPELQIVITDKHKNVVHSSIVNSATRENTSTFTHWSHWWVPEHRGKYYVFLLPKDKNITSRRLNKRYYMRRLKV